MENFLETYTRAYKEQENNTFDSDKYFPQTLHKRYSVDNNHFLWCILLTPRLHYSQPTMNRKDHYNSGIISQYHHRNSINFLKIPMPNLLLNYGRR